MSEKPASMQIIYKLFLNQNSYFMILDAFQSYNHSFATATYLQNNEELISWFSLHHDFLPILKLYWF